MDALCALLDCAVGISPVTSYSGVKMVSRTQAHSAGIVFTLSKGAADGAIVPFE